MLFKDLLETNYKKISARQLLARQVCAERQLNQATTKVLGKTLKEIVTTELC